MYYIFKKMQMHIKNIWFPIIIIYENLSPDHSFSTVTMAHEIMDQPISKHNIICTVHNLCVLIAQLL